VFRIHPLVVNVGICRHDLVVLDRIIEQNHDPQFRVIDCHALPFFDPDLQAQICFCLCVGDLLRLNAGYAED
jgi:hypothetical protein